MLFCNFGVISLQRMNHLVEGGSEAADFVLTADINHLVQVAMLRNVRGAFHQELNRTNNNAGHPQPQRGGQ